MVSTSRRTVISGIGCLNSLGSSAAALWDAALQGRSGIKAITLFDTAGLPVRIAAEMTDFKANNFVPKEEKELRKSFKMMARTIEIAVCAARLAMAEGCVDRSKIDSTRFGCSFGSGLIAMNLTEVGDASYLSLADPPQLTNLQKWGDKENGGLKNIEPLWMLKYLPNFLACHVSIMYDAQGPNNTITESDVASLLALGEARRAIERNAADFMLVGAAESKVNPLSMVRQCLFEPLSRRNEEPEKACRPFDRQRDGIVLGEGGAVLVVEDLEHAQKRGAHHIYAEVVGFGAAFDAKKTGGGIARAVRAALEDAGIGPNDVDHINAHGLGSVDSDAWEAHGLYEVFGGCSPAVPVYAAKSALGNLGAAGGITELALSVFALHHGKLPGTLNFSEPDPNCPVTVHTGAPRPVQKPYAVKVGFTQMGQCAAVVVKKFSQS